MNSVETAGQANYSIEAYLSYVKQKRFENDLSFEMDFGPVHLKSGSRISISIVYTIQTLPLDFFSNANTDNEYLDPVLQRFNHMARDRTVQILLFPN